MPLCLCCIADWGWDERLDGNCPGVEWDPRIGMNATVETRCVVHGTNQEELDWWDALGDDASLAELRRRFGVEAR